MEQEAQKLVLKRMLSVFVHMFMKHLFSNQFH